MSSEIRRVGRPATVRQNAACPPGGGVVLVSAETASQFAVPGASAACGRSRSDAVDIDHGQFVGCRLQDVAIVMGLHELGAGCRPGPPARASGSSVRTAGRRSRSSPSPSPAVRAVRRSRCCEKKLCFPIDLGGGTPTTKRLPYTRAQEFDASVSAHRSMTDEDQSGRSQGGRGWLLG